MNPNRHPTKPLIQQVAELSISELLLKLSQSDMVCAERLTVNATAPQTRWQERTVAHLFAVTVALDELLQASVLC